MACSSGDLAKERIQRKINRHRNEGEDITKLLQACKCWNGPCTTANELEIVLLNKTRDGGNKIVRIELSYYRKTHQAERYETPELFKLTKISHEETPENLVLLSNGTSKRELPHHQLCLTHLLMKNYGLWII